MKCYSSGTRQPFAPRGVLWGYIVALGSYPFSLQSKGSSEINRYALNSKLI